MSRISLSIAAATLLAFTAMPVAATTDPAATPTPWEQRIDQLFLEIDGNDDGFIDATEAKADKGLEKAFPRIAKTGKLDQEQFVAWYKLYDMPAAQE